MYSLLIHIIIALFETLLGDVRWAVWHSAGAIEILDCEISAPPFFLGPIILIHSLRRTSGASGATQGGRNSIDGRQQEDAGRQQPNRGASTPPTIRQDAEVFALYLVFDRIHFITSK